MTLDWNALEAAARTAMTRAYSKYSQFSVGAALLTDKGIFVGANIENVSYGLTICAERVAIPSALIAGAAQFYALVITCSGQSPATPCGACRQVIAEFTHTMPIRCVGASGAVLEANIAELLPFAFDFDHSLG